MHILKKLKKELVITSSNSDQKIKEFISKEILNHINGGQQYFIRKLVFDTKRNWNEVLKNAIEEMPELKLKLKNYNLEANFEEEAGYTEEQWKELDEKTKKQYLEEHPNSKYAKKDNGGNKSSETKLTNNPDEEKLLNKVSNDPESIQYIKNPSEKVQLEAVKNNGYVIEYIKNPSEKVQLEAVKRHPYALKYIKNPSEKVQLEAVRHNGNTIEFIKNPTDEMKWAAIKDYKDAIKYIKNPTDEMKKFAKNKKSAIDLAIEEEEHPMTTEEAKEYWKNNRTSDPILEDYNSFEDWYKESKQNGYIKDEVVDRPTEYFSGELTIDNWEDKPAKDSYFNDKMSYIGQGIKDAIGANSSGRLDIKYADGEDKENAFISIADKDTGVIYNVVIDSYGIDIMDENMTESYLAGEVENGYFEPNDLESVVQFLKKDITGDSSTYDAGHAEEWMERHPHGYYNSEDDYGTDSEDEYNETMTTEEAKEYWKEHHNDDPILMDYDNYEDWYKESKQNGYIKD